jgi:hypothetical protein
MDKLDALIFGKLELPSTLLELLEQVKPAFSSGDTQADDERLMRLILGRVRHGIQHRVIKSISGQSAG